MEEEESGLVVTPAMRAKIEELCDLVIGALPGYKIAEINLSVVLASQAARPLSEAGLTDQVLTISHRCRSRARGVEGR
jgi:hypothetical protein